MISYADLEFAIDRWKARAAGIPQPAPTVASGTVAAQVPVATAPEEMSEGVSDVSIGQSTEVPSSGTPDEQS
jgi:hypothetical protein